jgi:hypothetical protein
MSLHLAPGYGSARPPGTRTSRRGTRDRQLESLAAEFALLAQRRARVAHRIDLLDSQRAAASAALNNLQSRMAWLTRQIAALDPTLPPLRELRPGLAAPASPPPALANAQAVAGSASGANASGRPRPIAKPATRPRGFAGKWRS